MPLTEQTKLINREVSWIAFNKRVLAEAMNASNPLLERLKFIGIVSSNFDEFFMVRIAGLDDNEPNAIRIKNAASAAIVEQNDYLNSILIPEMQKNGIYRAGLVTLPKEIRQHFLSIFQNELFPLLTPMMIDDRSNFLKLNNLSLHIIFKLKENKESGKIRYAVIEVPKKLPRIFQIPNEEKYAFVFLEDIVTEFSNSFFTGYEILESGLMRITRAAEMSLDEEKDEDFAKVITEALRARLNGKIVRLEIKASKDLVNFVSDQLQLPLDVIHKIEGWMDLKSASQISFQNGLEQFKIEAWEPKLKHDFKDPTKMWRLIRERDLFIHHPYDSFDQVIQFLRNAAEDPDVLAIKQTLYRIDQNSLIAEQLKRAAENGKHVTVLVELKARFDEDHNVEWAKRLERAGVTVLYGVARLKTHAKLLLIVRREPEGLRRYVHISTGNYNAKTAKLYSDIGFFTSNEDFGQDATTLFNAITGYSSPNTWKKIDAAPFTLKRKLIRLILREGIKATKENPGLIIAKMNSLVDPDVIEALYRASQAGVRIKLNVRGICCLRPGILGLSENIEVFSIIDRFLEHSRIVYFQNGGQDELYISSADWMSRNLERRIELFIPIEDSGIKKELFQLLELYTQDNCKSWQMDPSGQYVKKMSDKSKKIQAQESLMKKTLDRHQSVNQNTDIEIIPRKPKTSSLANLGD